MLIQLHAVDTKKLGIVIHLDIYSIHTTMLCPCGLGLRIR